MDNLEILKKAINVEVKNKYINLKGKNEFFSDFICSFIKRIIKTSSISDKWKAVLDCFQFYSTSSMPDRKKSIEFFVKILKIELSKQNNKKSDKKIDPFSDVTYVKGVGPKIASILNKLGIYTASDLLFYFPRKHIDYSKRTLISNLVENETVTVFGYIKSVESFITPKGLGVMKVKIVDETGSININFFYAKSSRYVLERSKRQFPKGSGIIISGVVKINSFDNKPTLENTTYSIMSEDFISNKNLNLARIVPIYSLSENLNVKTLRKAIIMSFNFLKIQL